MWDKRVDDRASWLLQGLAMLRKPFGALLVGSLAFALVSACSEDGATRRANQGTRPVKDPNAIITDPADTRVEVHPDPFEGLLTGTDQIQALCKRAGPMDDSNENFNAVTVAFCKQGKRPTSLAELRDTLGLSFKATDPNATNGSNGNPAFALSGHSQSLLARSTSSVNPRAFIFSPPQGQPTRIKGFVIMSYTRGEQFAEVISETGLGGKITAYLVKFDLPCGTGCSNGDLLTPAVEQNWTGVTIYDDEDLKNTIVDCRQCHQPGGPRSPMMLRMQELEDPWTHWFRSDRPGGLTLMQDYFRAHGEDEDYGAIPGVLINKSDGRALEDFVKGQGFDQQPNTFDSKTIEAEVTQASLLQPEVNTPRGTSSTWQDLYDKAANGQFIPAPYHDVKVTDPNKLEFVTEGYKKFIAGQAQTMPDIRRVFLDDALEDLSFFMRQGASGKDVLLQSCAQCHNGRLDQSISRAHFDATALDSMSAAEKKEAIRRMNLPSADREHMPPNLLRALPDDALAAASAELNK
jgi:hypothetical protein